MSDASEGVQTPQAKKSAQPDQPPPYKSDENAENKEGKAEPKNTDTNWKNPKNPKSVKKRRIQPDANPGSGGSSSSTSDSESSSNSPPDRDSGEYMRRRRSRRDRGRDLPGSQSGWISFVLVVLVLIVLPVLCAYLYNEREDRNQMVIAFGKFQSESLSKISALQTSFDQLRSLNTELHTDLAELRSQYERSVHVTKIELETQTKEVELLAQALDGLQNDKTKMQTDHKTMSKTVTHLNSMCEKSATRIEMETQHTQLTHAFENLKTKTTRDLKKISNRHTDFQTSVETLTSKSIVAWYGPQDKIPQGWRLCDGKKHTPSLAGRTLVGAGKGYDVNSQGGKETASVTFKLTKAQLPPHNHHADDGFKHILKVDGENTVKRQDSTAGEPNLRYSRELATVGKGEPVVLSFDNRPPYHAVYFICRKN
eukprot:m.105348 g.105348  ORF g.105348 m.105348 type:complete len:425 (+) comp27639_c0_seq1:344-1618(+)